MSDDIANRMINEGVADADHLKIQTAEALEEAARNLRRTDVSAMGEDVKHILRDVEKQVNQFKTEVNAEYQKIESDYHKNAEPVESLIIDHPIPSLLFATGIGILLGMLIIKTRN